MKEGRTLYEKREGPSIKKRENPSIKKRENPLTCKENCKTRKTQKESGEEVKRHKMLPNIIPDTFLQILKANLYKFSPSTICLFLIVSGRFWDPTSLTASWRLFICFYNKNNLSFLLDKEDFFQDDHHDDHHDDHAYFIVLNRTYFYIFTFMFLFLFL